MKTNILSFLVCLFVFSLNAQSDSSHWKVILDIEGSGLHLSPIKNHDEINIDPTLSVKRNTNNPFGRNKGVATDNPNFHAATYAGLKLNTSFRRKYQLHGNLYFEHRGASYGANDQENTVWFPEIFFIIQDTFQVFNRKFGIDFKLGNQSQHQVENGLKIYNLDDQGLDFKISHKNFFIRYNQIGDLSFGIGLDLEEYMHYAIGYENKDFKISISRAWNSMIYWRQGVQSYQEWNLSGNYFLNKNYEFYFQVGTRYFQGYDIQENSAFVIGAKCTFIKNKKITWFAHPKIRYYSANYNYGHYYPRVIYRKSNGNVYSNTVGRYLYPLRNYYYDFDQWAVFTEYQNQDVLGLGLKTNFKIKIYTNFQIESELETLSIRRRGGFYTNYFYGVDISYVPVKGLNIGLRVTNKTYNLDVHFPTFYMMKYPMAGIHIKLNGIGKMTLLK